MTMKKYSIIHIPVLSFFSKKLYRDVGLHWKGVNFLYLLLLLAICWIPAMIKIHVGFTGFVEDYASGVVEQLPEITIDNGEASISEPQPYYIKDPESGNVLAIIDTTGQIESLEGTDAFCLLTRDKVITKKSNVENRTYNLSQIKHFVLNSERVMGWMRTANKYLVIAIYPFALLGSYLFRIVQALIYAAVGLMFAVWCKAALSYATLLRLAVVAMTPCMIAKTIFGPDLIPLFFVTKLIFLAITLSYLFFAVKANSEVIVMQEETEEPEMMI